MVRRGWKNDSARHSLAARGVKSRPRKSPRRHIDKIELIKKLNWGIRTQNKNIRENWYSFNTRDYDREQKKATLEVIHNLEGQVQAFEWAKEQIQKIPPKAEVKYKGIKTELEEFEQQQRLEGIMEALGELSDEELLEIRQAITEELESPQIDLPHVNGGYVTKLKEVKK